MIHRRSPEEIEKMRTAARILVESFQVVKDMIGEDVRTIDIDSAVEKFILKAKANPAFKGYRGYPKSTCISIDEVVVHGIPNKKSLEDGQIVSVDIGVELNGYFSDASRTFAIGNISTEKRHLMEITEESLHRGIEKAMEGNRISDISQAIQTFVESAGYSVVRELVGHGIGTSLHEAPEIPNYVDERHGIQPRITEGMVFAIEPMVNTGGHQITFLSDGWTVIATDRKPSAHFEHTVAVTENGPEILTIGR